MDDKPDSPTAAARTVCAACPVRAASPVRAACLAHALAHDEPWGVWGGLTTRERVLIRYSSQAISFSTANDNLYAVSRSTLRPVCTT